MNLSGRDNLPSLYLITDRKLVFSGLETALESALKAGVRMIQLREKDLGPEELRKLAAKIRMLTRRYAAKLLINNNSDLALEIGADGVQLGVHSCSVAEARKHLGPQALIGYSAHSSFEVQNAAQQGADFVTFSPVYYTPSKAQYGAPQGLKALHSICKESPLPVYALGGITPPRISEVISNGACGVAMISAILGQADIAKAVTTAINTIKSCSKG